MSFLKNKFSRILTQFRYNSKIFLNSRSSLSLYNQSEKSVCAKIMGSVHRPSGNIRSNNTQLYCPSILLNTELIHLPNYRKRPVYHIPPSQIITNHSEMKKFKRNYDPDFDIELFKKGVKQVRN